MVEEDTGTLRMGRGLRPPLSKTRTRVSKGFTCRRASLNDTTIRQGTLSPSTDLRGTTIFKKRTHRELVSFIAPPRTPTCTHRLDETSMSRAREYMYPSLLSEGTLSENEEELGEGEHESYHRLNVTGRNPILSDSNIADWKRPLPMEFPTKAVSAEHQSRPLPPPLGRSRKLLPIRCLNIGGLGVPRRAQQQQPKGKDYKPGRIVNTSFDCFRCENRMSAHYDHEWFESILTASRGRGTKNVDTEKNMKRPVGRKYSKDEISRALFPRYWNKECMSPDSKPFSRTPDTRPVTQTPDTISGPWKVGNIRPDSMEGMKFTREDLKGFCEGHERIKCKPGSKHDARLAPYRQRYSDTQIGLNFTTCGEIWCHDADVCTDSCSPGRMEHEKSDYVSRNESRISHNGKASRLSDQSRDGYQRVSSGFEFRMRFHCDNSDDVFYELHEEDSNHCTNPAGMATVQVACSLTSNDIRRLDVSRWDCDADPKEQDEVHSVDNGGKCCNMTNTTPFCCYSQTSDSQDVLEGSCIPKRRSSHLKCYSVLSPNPSHSRSSTRSVSNGDVRLSTFKSQIDCNTSAVERFPKLEVKGKKAATGFSAKDVRRSLSRDLKEHHLTNEDQVESTRCNGPLEVDAPKLSIPTETVCEHEDQEYESYELKRRQIDLQFDDEEDENEAEEEEEQLFEEEHDADLFSQICDGQLTRNNYKHTYPDLPKPLGRHFCYVPIVDKRYNRWKRRKPKKRKQAQMNIRQPTMKTSSSTSDESAVLDGRESKRSKRSRKHASKSPGKKRRQISRNESRGPTPRELPQDEEQDLSESFTEPEYEPVFDQADLADETQFPNSTEANTDSSKSSLTSSGSRSSTNLHKLESYVTSSPITLIDIQDPECSSVPSGYEVQNTPEDNFKPEQITAKSRARGRVASIPSKNYPRTQKSLLSLSLRGPSVEKELQTTVPMKALPRTGGRLPLLGTQRSILARSSENMLSCVPGDTSYVSGWIKRGIMQKTSNEAIISLPRTDLKLAAEKYPITASCKTGNPKTGSTKDNAKSRSAIPGQTKASTEEKFAPIVRSKKRIGSSKKRHEARKSGVQDKTTVYLADEEDEDCDNYPTFTLKDLLSTLPDSDSSAHSVKQVDSRTRKRNKSPTNLTNIFKKFVKGSQMHKRKTPGPEVGRSNSALSLMPVFTFSVYTLPKVYRSRNVSNGSSK